MNDLNEEKDAESLKDKVSGTMQKIIGEAEIIGGALTGDPTTAAEGEFNVEVGEIREELEKVADADDEADQ